MGSKTAATEIIGVMLLLGIAVSLFSVVYFSILSTDLQEDAPSLFILGSIDENNDLVVYHQGGESVDGENNIQVEIAGIIQPLGKLESYIKQDSNNDKDWNFGETISYPLENISNLEVKINIVDRHSNSLILSSVLQEGYAVSGFGLGGIWHLDEGSGTTAYDSTGNLNHGRINGANWTTGINNSALAFDPYDENYVRVNDKISLDISNNLTLEAWVKPNEVSNKINESEFDASFGYYPTICKANQDVYALVYRGGSSTNDDCVLKTIGIYSNGHVYNESMAELVIDTSCVEPKVIQIAQGLIAVAYGDSSGQCHLKTYLINNAGGIIFTGQEYVQGSDCEEISIKSVTNDVFSIAYGDKNEGYLFTIGITDTGIIGAELDSITFNHQCEDTDLIHFTDDLFILGYIGDTGDYLRSFQIDEFGVITDTGYSIEYFDGSDDPDLVRVSDDCVAVTFEDDKKNGVVKTYLVSGAGEFSPTSYVLQFEDDDCHDPDIIQLYNDVYTIAYEGPTGHIGRLARIRIESDGEIDSTYRLTDYDTQRGYSPYMLKISSYVYVIVYMKESPHPGGLTTFSHVADISYPSYFAGIFKSGSFGIYTNYTTAYAFINNKTISYNGVNPGWVHLAVVYDSSTIRLYVNATEVVSESYSNNIQVNDYPFFIGNAFSGKIDEVALYGKALTPDQILDHYQNPGSFS